jgi:hypothetical protein
VAPPELPRAVPVTEPKQKLAIERPQQDRMRASHASRISAPPVPNFVSATTESVPVPAKLTCQTSTIAGERVRMECFPVQADQ